MSNFVSGDYELLKDEYKRVASFMNDKLLALQYFQELYSSLGKQTGNRRKILMLIDSENKEPAEDIYKALNKKRERTTDPSLGSPNPNKRSTPTILTKRGSAFKVVQAEERVEEQVGKDTIKQEEEVKDKDTDESHRKTFVVNHKADPSSNWNTYTRTSTPQFKKLKTQLKDKVPFLRDFSPKFLKKENIDKKVLRKFRKYIKANNVSLNLTGFWKDFNDLNLLPPMKYSEGDAKIEFKSFNTNYILWLFSKPGAVELYKEFVDKLGDKLLQGFIETYDLLKSTEDGVVDKLKYYINNIHEFYGVFENKDFTFGQDETQSGQLSDEMKTVDRLMGHAGDTTEKLHAIFNVEKRIESG
jgi:hypothetical protein